MDLRRHIVELALAGADLVVGHQVRIDLDVMSRSFADWVPPPAVDTLRLARAQFPDLPGHKLGDLVQTFGLDPLDGRAHRAGHDTTVTARLLVHDFAQRAYATKRTRKG